ncbi:enoyl-CoA hydratase/isomerase family protein [Paraglaciecola hydrolytica]|uniref:3-hydroxyisobutyryl-CoA hydrolase n=1 Tax=Paraglaciecola hydrolytica TaxID=1799789 RepID=A0A135ZYI7_9ALTE|nr:enoyl-CoA hydratase/isomerase family protein [Paraglaciecola hydrolytica]KXI28046.1 enoyl-CoA hydratase [Paraglaciecola hydrolytica]
MSEQPKVLFELIHCQNGSCIGLASLNKPKALNALDSDMITLLTVQLEAWKQDPSICMLVLDSQLDKAFCAGGDVVAMHKAMAANRGKLAPQVLQDFFTHEYQLDYLIHSYKKPILVWGHGIVMGGGLGLMAGASHRIVTETSRIAMPEINIGLYPDVGGSYFLNKMPAGCGLFLGLTGASINAADALYCQLADYVIPHANKAAFIQRLQQTDWQSDAQVNHLLLYALCRESEDKNVLPNANLIIYQSLFTELASYATVAEVERHILTMNRAEDKWFSKAQQTLKAGSNITKHLVFEQLKRGRELSLDECFRMELVMSCHCGTVGEFQEGVRALLIDKDNQPQWLYPNVEAVPADIIEGFFDSPWSVTQHPLATLGAKALVKN